MKISMILSLSALVAVVTAGDVRGRTRRALSGEVPVPPRLMAATAEPTLIFYSNDNIRGTELVKDYELFEDLTLNNTIGNGISVCSASGGDLIPIQCQTSFRFSGEEEGAIPSAFATQGITDLGRGFSIVTGGTGDYLGVTGHGYATLQDDGIRVWEYWLKTSDDSDDGEDGDED